MTRKEENKIKEAVKEYILCPLKSNMKISKTETRLKANREKKLEEIKRQVYKEIPDPKEPKQTASNIKPKPVKELTPSQRAAATTNAIKAERRPYNPPTQNLTDKEALEFHLMYIRGHDQETVGSFLPGNMHISNDGYIRWKRGLAPGTYRAATKNMQSGTSLNRKKRENANKARERIQFPGNKPSTKLTPKDKDYNNIDNIIASTNGVRKITLKTLKDFYQDALQRTETVYLDGIKHTDKVGKLLTVIQIHMIKKLVKKPDSYNLLSQIITDLRLNAGELPRQELAIESKQSVYHEHDFSGLVEAADAILARRRTLPKPDNKADNAIIEEAEVIEVTPNPSNNNDLDK